MELPELRQNNLSKNLIFHLHGGMDDLLTTISEWCYICGYRE